MAFLHYVGMMGKRDVYPIHIYIRGRFQCITSIFISVEFCMPVWMHQSGRFGGKEDEKKT